MAQRRRGLRRFRGVEAYSVALDELVGRVVDLPERWFGESVEVV